ncbi:MAG: threonine ammonia-lyase IlvA [Cyclobacteriaceae bacterium]|nr:threonine ammonia-lyase IlvA [Cyclobacteriaceae bacterium]
MIQLKNIEAAAVKLQGVVNKTPLLKNLNLSERYGADISLKREDLQVVRSYKIRGAYNKIISLSTTEKENGVVCASAGNHAQGVAYACRLLDIKGTIFMPTPTPKQKVKQVINFGKEHIEIVLTGDTYDEAAKEAKTYCHKNNAAFIHPFDDVKVMEGQATVGLEILAEAQGLIDYLILPIGGGGLASGVGTYFKQLSPNTIIIGVEPQGAPSMSESMAQNEVVTLSNINKFVDGAAVQRVGDKTFEICKQKIDRVITVPEGEVCTNILRLYNEDAIVVEPAGALSITALNKLSKEIKGKRVVCIVSGGNNDITRTAEIKERSMLHEGLKHYFMINFPQRVGALREFLVDVLGPADDISHFEYSKKNSRERAPAIIGIELAKASDFVSLIERMEDKNIKYEHLNNKPELFHYLI